MKTKIFSLSDQSFASQLVEVECHPGKGLPITTIVGMAGRPVAESRERLRAAFQASGIPYPRRRLTINLAPADIPKRGSGYDLAIAASIMTVNNLVRPDSLPTAIYSGELGLDGSIRATRGIIGQIISAKLAGFDRFFIPAANVAQARLVPGVTLIAIRDLREFYDYCHGLAQPDIINTGAGYQSTANASVKSDHLSGITGQAAAKRALVIAAAGGHNLLLQGRPGTGKTLLGRALIELLPPMNQSEVLAATHLCSLTESDFQSVVTARPVVAPHHSTTVQRLVGGGRLPGAIQRAQAGVLLLDELPEFSRGSIEALRQPLETVTTETACPVQFVATANPCPCGYYGHESATCRCSSYNISRYREKLSGPLIDRIDLFVTVDDVEHQNLIHQPETDDIIASQRQVLKARTLQAERYKSTTINANCPDTIFKKHCLISQAAKQLLDEAASRLNVSARNYMRSLRIARTIADLESKRHIEPQHVAEALQYRPRSGEPS